MLHRLNQKQLAKTLFPLGELCKPEVKEIAQKLNLPTSYKKESQDLCFLGKDGVKGFLQRQTTDKMQAGFIVNSKGELLGKHQGLMAYTIGQRKGLGIAANKPLFVIGKDFKNNKLIVGSDDERKKQTFYLQQEHFISEEIPTKPLKANIKIRYQAAENPAWISYEKNRIKVKLLQPVADLSPGQGAVFYSGEQILGGGIISHFAS